MLAQREKPRRFREINQVQRPATLHISTHIPAMTKNRRRGAYWKAGLRQAALVLLSGVGFL